MPRIYLSPPHMGQHERALLLEAFDSNWVAPAWPPRRRIRARILQSTRQFRTRAHSRAARRACIWRSSCSASAAATTLSRPRSPSRRPQTPSRTSARPRSSSTASARAGTWIRSSSRRSLRTRRSAASSRRPWSSSTFTASAPITIASSRRARDTTFPSSRTRPKRLARRTRARAPGSFGKMAVFSFNGNKIITTGGGGMLVAHDKALHRQARASSRRRRATRRRTISTTHVGYNYRLSNLLAAVGRGQLRVLHDRVRAAADEQCILSEQPARSAGRDVSS